MDIGKKTKRMQIQTASSVMSAGVPTVTWTTATTVWMERKSLNQKRLLENGQTHLAGTYIFYLLYNDYPALSVKNRMVDTEDGKVYTITSAVDINDEKREFEIIANNG